MMRSPYISVSQGRWDNGNRSQSTLRDAQDKMAFSNAIPVTSTKGPGRVLKKPAGSIIALVFEIFLCLVALCFIALALTALCIKNRPTGDELGAAMEQAMKLGPTIYPILFAALLSRSLKSIGRFCAQKSIRLSTLWALMNTNATADPILHLLSMPTSLLVWGLLVMWVMSPLGGQSTLRLLYKTNTTSTTYFNFRYLDNGPLGHMCTYDNLQVFNDGSWPLSIRDAFSTSLMQSIDVKSSPLDQWGNVKIPRLEAGNTSDTSADGWMSIKKGAGVDDFISLFGLPVVDLSTEKRKGDVRFNVETTYVHLSCPKIEYVQLDSSFGLTINCTKCFELDDGQFIRAQRFLGLPVEGNPRTEGVNVNTPNYTEPFSLLINSQSGDSSRTTCEMTQRMVEVAIECVGGNCAATKIRPSTTDHRSKNFTPFDYWAWSVLEMINGASRELSAGASIWGSSTSELFINDSSRLPLQDGISASTSTAGFDGANLSTVPPEVFSTRAAILLNTAIQTFMSPTGFAGSLSKNLTLYGPPHIPANGLLAVANKTAWDTYNNTIYFTPAGVGQILMDLAPFVGASTNATMIEYTEVYHPYYAWVIMLTISSILLFAVGVSGIAVRLMTMAPNIFDPVVGLTYANPYIIIPEKHGNPLDADDRANYIRNKTVQLGSVDEDAEAKVVFGEARYLNSLRLGVAYN